MGASQREDGNDVTLEPERLVAGGAALARLADGRVAFVSGALPNETVRVRLTPGSGRTLRGELLEILNASPDRCEPDCELAGDCGGCDWLHLDPGAGLDFKAGILAEALRRAGVPDAPQPTAHASPLGRPARARARLHIGPGGRLGFLAARSSRLVPVTRCPALRPALSQCLPALAEVLREVDRGPVGQLLLAADDRGRVVVWMLDERGRTLQLGQGRLLARALDSRGVECVKTGDDAGPLVFDGPRLEQQVPAGSFFQANPEANAELVARVLALAGESAGRAVDYFCGAGNLVLPLADLAWSAQGYELDRTAVALAAARAEELGLDARFDVADLDANPPKPGSVDLVLLDPPRRGARPLVEMLVQHPVPRLIQLGCDPATMARDGAILAGAGYCLAALEIYDFFPGTHHLEALACWECPG